MDDKEVFSFTPENPEPDDNNESFDLNSFSSANLNNQNEPQKKKGKIKKEKVIKTILTVFLIGVITCSIVVGSFFIYVFTMIDGTMEEDLDNLVLNQTTTIYYKNTKTGQWEEYQRLHGQFNRLWVHYDREAAESGDEEYTGIPQNLINAFVAVEDKRFYSHQGVDWKRTVAAFGNMFLHYYSSNQGGSTITQQLVKNLTGDNSQKPSRKIREIMRARYLEAHYAKDTIIECYLNTIAMGHGMYGVEVASNYYFGKSVNELTLEECASLASIAKSPTYYAPDDYPENNKERREDVLWLMHEQGYITDEEYSEVEGKDITLVASKEALNETEVNNYFVESLIREVTNDLAEKYGYDKSHASNMFYSGGYKIYATINPDIQNAVDAVFRDSKTYGITGKDGQQLQGAITVMDYEGNVVGLAGGIGEKTVNLGISGLNRATDAIRQPGSTMKPIAAYAPAIENNLITYSTLLNDTPANYNGWTPKNWYKTHYGYVTTEFALEKSMNTIPVYLVNKLTPQVSFDFLTKELGITTLNKADMDLSPLGMGGTNGGVTTLESAAAFAVFGSGGIYNAPIFYTEVRDYKDNVILESYSESSAAISPDTATVMNHLLQNVVYGNEGTGRKAASYLPSMKIYAKTGTSDSSNDLWFVGGTPYYIASCWCGYDAQQSISDSAIAIKMWGNVMSSVHKNLPAKDFEDSGYAKQLEYCTHTGLIATNTCPSVKTGWYKSNNIPESCTTHKASVQEDDGEEKGDEQNGENSNE